MLHHSYGDSSAHAHYSCSVGNARRERTRVAADALLEVKCATLHHEMKTAAIWRQPPPRSYCCAACWLVNTLWPVLFSSGYIAINM